MTLPRLVLMRAAPGFMAARKAASHIFSLSLLAATMMETASQRGEHGEHFGAGGAAELDGAAAFAAAEVGGAFAGHVEGVGDALHAEGAGRGG